MAEATGLRNNALPYPVYGAPYGVAFPILDADGDLVAGAAGLDSEISKNGDTFTDCTNEATQIATDSGTYYLLLTAAEMTADVVTVIVKTSTSGAKTTTLVFYPRKLVELASGTAQGGDTGYITLADGTVLFDGQYAGCLCVATIDGNVEARILQVPTASNQQATVTPAWNVAPDSDDTYKIYLPEGVRFPTANVKAISDDTTAADNCEAMFDGTGYAGGTAKLSVEVNTKTGFKLASDGLDSVSIASPSGVATNFREMMVQLWRRFFKKADRSSDTIQTYADNGTTVLTEQAISDVEGVETQGAATNP